MPANLTPQYKEVEQRYRRARTLPEKVAALQEMMAVIPKHKGTDHLRADLRARMSRHMEELEKPKSTSGGPQPFSIRKEGAGQVLIIGLPNAGKSEILNALTRAPAKVGDYPFTTQIPMVGMLPFENIKFQLVDTPALNSLDVQTRLFGLLRNTDLLLVTVNLEADPLEEMERINELLHEWGYSLLEAGEAIDLEGSRIQKLAIILANKCDAEGAEGKFRELERVYGAKFTIVKLSCLDGTGLDEVGCQAFKHLKKVRVYTKSPSGEPDFEKPIVIARGSTASDAAQRLHKEWREKLKYALLWGSAKFDGQRVGRDYVLADGDVIELHG